MTDALPRRLSHFNRAQYAAHNHLPVAGYAYRALTDAICLQIDTGASKTSIWMPAVVAREMALAIIEQCDAVDREQVAS